jgi:hypothetical protein
MPTKEKAPSLIGTRKKGSGHLRTKELDKKRAGRK